MSLPFLKMLSFSSDIKVLKLWTPLGSRVTNRSSVAPADRKRRSLGGGGGDTALTKWFYGLNSRLVLGPVIPNTLKIGVVPPCVVPRM